MCSCCESIYYALKRILEKLVEKNNSAPVFSNCDVDNSARKIFAISDIFSNRWTSFLGLSYQHLLGEIGRNLRFLVKK